MFIAKFLLRLGVCLSKISKVSPAFISRRLDSLSVRLMYKAVSKSGHSLCKCKGCCRS